MIDVSFVITAYNYAQYIGECIFSCLSQKETALKFELIVIDDGSTDETAAVLAKIKHPDLHIFRLENSGIECASNFGFAQAEGKYIVRVDADDVLDCRYLAEMEKVLSADYDIYYSNYQVIDSAGTLQEKILLPDFKPEEIRCRGDFLATGTLYTADVLKKMNGYSIAVKNSGIENYDLILRMIQAGIKGRHLPDVLFYYRRHGANMSATRKEQIIENAKKILPPDIAAHYCTNEYHPNKLRLK